MSIVCAYRVGRLFLFSHASLICSGAYLCLFLTRALGVTIQVAILMAVLFSAVLGCFLELLVYRLLRRQEAKSMIFILASLGVYTLLQNGISLLFGDESKTLCTSPVREGVELFGAHITPIQISTIAAAIVVMIGLLFFGKYTHLGKSIRAVSSDSKLAKISGVHSDRVILWSVAIGSGLAGLVGILMALDTGMTPTMGMQPYMIGIVVMIIGGRDSIVGIALGALLLAFAQQYGAYYIGSQWQDAIAFVILVLFLLFKPEGFFGKKVESATV